MQKTFYLLTHRTSDDRSDRPEIKCQDMGPSLAHACRAFVHSVSTKNIAAFLWQGRRTGPAQLIGAWSMANNDGDAIAFWDSPWSIEYAETAAELGLELIAPDAPKPGPQPVDNPSPL